MTLTKIHKIELDILIDDQDKGHFYLGCSQCKRTTKDYNAFFTHLFKHMEDEFDKKVDLVNWELKKNANS